VMISLSSLTLLVQHPHCTPRWGRWLIRLERYPRRGPMSSVSSILIDKS
jgi:hypothetical protein